MSYQSNRSHTENLAARAQKDGQKHAFSGRPKNVAVNKLPPELFLGVLAAVDLVVPRDVFVQRPEQDHGHHARQEQDDHERVEDREPLDVRVGHTLEDVIPPGAPFDGIVLFKGHSIGVGDGYLVGRLGRNGKGQSSLEYRTKMSVNK